MDRITQTHGGACKGGGCKGGGCKGGGCKGGFETRPYERTRGKRRWGKDVWIFVLCCCSLMFFCLGLYLGGLTMRNKVAAVAAEMEETQQQLEQCDSSVILVDKGFAAQIGYHPGKKDLVCTSGGV